MRIGITVYTGTDYILTAIKCANFTYILYDIKTMYQLKIGNDRLNIYQFIHLNFKAIENILLLINLCPLKLQSYFNYFLIHNIIT